MWTKIFHNARVLSALQQCAVLAVVAAVFYVLITNASANLDALGIASGFDFLQERAGYVISFQLIDYSPDDTYLRAYAVGLLNTLLVSILSIALATIMGVFLGICRVSENWLLGRLSHLAVEFLRNVPLIVHLIWWYGLLLALPNIRQAISINDVVFLSNRGLTLTWASDGSLVGWGYCVSSLVPFSAMC